METKEIKSIIMFDIKQINDDTTFIVFVTDSFKDYDVVHNTIISMAKIVNGYHIRSIINNTVYFVNSTSYSENVAIDERVARIIYEHVKNKNYEIWI